jgi:hypothetical protein
LSCVKGNRKRLTITAFGTRSADFRGSIFIEGKSDRNGRYNV